jgi:hypothetical protein
MSAGTLQEQSPAVAAASAVMPVRGLVVLASALLAAWIAAGSIGFMAPPLQKGACWLALAVVVLAAWPERQVSSLRWLGVMATACLVAVLFIALPLPVVNVLAVVVVLAAAASAQSGPTARGLLAVALAATVLAVFRLAVDSTATAWWLSNTFGRAMGGLVGRLTGRPLRIGGSFAGLDFLVTMTALTAVWLAWSAPPRKSRVLWAAAAILAAQGIYLLVLAFAGNLKALLPATPQPAATDVSILGVWTWGNALRTLLPWNVPLLAAALHLTVAMVLFRRVWARPAADKEPAEAENPGVEALRLFGPAVLAIVAALAVVLATSTPNLDGRRIVAYDAGGLDWGLDEGRFASNTAEAFGLLPPLVESLGGRLIRSPELAERDLAEADVLLLLPPAAAPPALQARIWQFVQRGGALLVAAGEENRRLMRESPLDRLLAATGIGLGGRVVVPAAANWEHTCQAAPHSATAGLDVGPATGFEPRAALRTSWPAGPLVVGRWAWSRPHADPARSTAEYSPGDDLGDLVLAAQQQVGGGSVVVLADASCLTNSRLPASYPLVGRLLAALANRAGGPLALWRQLLGLAALAGFVALSVWRTGALRLAGGAAVLAVAILVASAPADAAPVWPEGRGHSPHRPIAYIDASHQEAFAHDPWSPDGLGQLTRILGQTGFLPLLAPDVTPGRLDRAAVLVSIAPARAFSPAERQAVREFVDFGGVFISLVGAEQSVPSKSLLADFGLEVPAVPVPPGQLVREPWPLGAFYQSYGDAAHEKDNVQFYAAWPITHGEGARPLVEWSDIHTVIPVAVSQPSGQGRVMLISDTCFAMNKNMESVRGAAPANTRFWQWLLADLAVRPASPPPPRAAKPSEPVESDMIDAAPAGKDAKRERP